MESYKIEVSTPKTPRISTLVQNVEQQMAILLRGKQKGQKSHEIAKKKKKSRAKWERLLGGIREVF